MNITNLVNFNQNNLRIYLKNLVKYSIKCY